MTQRIMPGLRISYDGAIPAEIIDPIAAIVDANVDLLPSWVLLLQVQFESESEGRTASKLEYQVAYRRVTLIIFATWLENSPAVRTEIIVHEFLHAHVATLHVCAVGTVDLLKKHNAELADSAEDDIRFCLEQTIVDLTEMVCRLRANNDREGDVGALFEHGDPCRSGPTNKRITRGERHDVQATPANAGKRDGARPGHDPAQGEVSA